MITPALTLAEDDLKLPDPLADAQGKPITTAEAWEKEVRPRTLELFREHVYGRSPAAPKWDKAASTFTPLELPADSGMSATDCVLKFPTPKGQLEVKLRLVEPKPADKPVPLFILINNRAPDLADLDKPNEFWPAAKIAKRGYATAIVHVAQFDPDKNEGFKDGVHALYDTQPRKPDSWATIAAWSWGASRVIDALSTRPGIDPKKIAVIGHSRGGKAALWCGAQDERVALTISNDSGCTGAALSRRIHGETVADINKGFSHWFCENYHRYYNKEQELPVDQHQLIALLAPRLAYVASAKEDDWADPLGEFLCCVHAGPVYRLLGVTGLESDKMPEAGGHLHGGRIGYHIRPGTHNLTLVDWKEYLDFADRHWK
ncbi:alpha/beta hydrolase [Haloferula sp. BvORR071]|uniref:glucuronyl esterase domain-containing protein n=1 Tax=Haloferula sp. BvORR071 TaxID=1396141 RepID=UPI000698BB62|nr:alpha/beta hydrolase [Haloferula sp. BvORR071]